jgi:hypothetical protein
LDGLKSLYGVIYNSFLFIYSIIKLFSGSYKDTDQSNKTEEAKLNTYRAWVKAGFKWCMEDRFRVGPAIDRKWYYSKKESIISFPMSFYIFKLLGMFVKNLKQSFVFQKLWNVELMLAIWCIGYVGIILQEKKVNHHQKLYVMFQMMDMWAKLFRPMTN